MYICKKDYKLAFINDKNNPQLFLMSELLMDSIYYQLMCFGIHEQLIFVPYISVIFKIHRTRLECILWKNSQKFHLSLPLEPVIPSAYTMC